MCPWVVSLVVDIVGLREQLREGESTLSTLLTAGMELDMLGGWGIQT